MFLGLITSAEPEFRVYDKPQEKDVVTHSVGNKLPAGTIVGIALSAFAIIFGIIGCFLYYRETNSNNKDRYLEIIIAPIYLMIIYWLILGVYYYEKDVIGRIILSILLFIFGIFIWGPLVILLFIMLYYMILFFVLILYYVFVYPISLIFK